MTENPPARIEIHRTEDATAKAVEILAPQLASAGTFLADLEIDDRKMSRLNKLEIVAIAYFEQEAIAEDNDWLKGFLGSYLALKMSEEGHERSKLLVEALGRIGGSDDAPLRRPDDRGWVKRNVTARNKGPEGADT